MSRYPVKVKPGDEYYPYGRSQPPVKVKLLATLGTLAEGVSPNGVSIGPGRLVGYNLYGDKWGEWWFAVLTCGEVMPHTFKKRPSK